jgi:calcineurin-like phosphoesterase
MVGARESVLGVKKENVIYKMKTKMLTRFDFADGEIEAYGAIFEIDEDTFKCTSCNLVKF